MKPFNLDEFKAGKPAIRRDGVVARFEMYVPDANDVNQVVYSFEYVAGRVICTVDVTGHYIKGCDNSTNDLVGMAATKRTVYVNLLSGGAAFWFSREHDAKTHASELQHTAVKTVQVEIEE